MPFAKVILSPFEPPALNLVYISLITSLNILAKDLSILGKIEGWKDWSRYI
jgi:hypothetical protein